MSYSESSNKIRKPTVEEFEEYRKDCNIHGYKTPYETLESALDYFFTVYQNPINNTMTKRKRFAIHTKRIHGHYAPAGFMTSFEVAIDSINFTDTREEAEKIIEDIIDDSQDIFWTIEEVFLPVIQAPTPQSQT